MAVNKKLGEDPYERLANAIILLAVSDYRAALKKIRKNPQSREALHDITALEEFFRSGWYRMLTDVDGEYLIRRLRKENQSK